MSLPAGKLNKWVLIEQKTETISPSGAPIQTWSTFKNIWAAMPSVRGREFVLADQLQSQIIVEATIRANQGVEPLMRLTYRGVVYNIEAVLPDDTWNEFEKLMLSGGISNG